MTGVTRTPILPHTRHSCAQRVDGCAPPGAPVLGECVDPIGRARSPVALCPSLRVLSPPPLATRFARRHKARRRLCDASSAQTVRRWRNNDSGDARARPAVCDRPKIGKNSWAHMGRFAGFPTHFPPASAQRKVRILTRLHSCSSGGKTALLDWQAAASRSLLDTRGTQRQVLWTKIPTFLT